MAPEVASVAARLGHARDWSEVSLGSVADVRFSSVDKFTSPSEPPIRLCNYTDVYNNDYITSDLEFMSASATRPEIARFGLQVGDVIITKDSETPDDIGIPAVVDHAAPDLVCGYHLGLLRPNREVIDPTFFAKQLGHHRLAKYFGRQANGLTRYGLPIASVTSAPIQLPGLGEQRAIGLILRRADDAIAKTEAVIAKLKQVRAGLLHDLFTRGLDEHGQIRPSPAQSPNRFKESSLGMFPCEWDAGSLDDLISPERPIVYGILMPGRGFPGGVPVIKVKDIRGGKIDTSDLLLTDPRIDAAYQRSRVQAGDLLFTIRGTVGRMALVPAELMGANITQDTARVGLPTSNAVFVARWLESEIALRFVAVHTIGVAVQGINLGDVRRIPVPIVSRREQDAIVEQMSAHEQRIVYEQQVALKLECLKSGLMSDLLTGRVRVPAELFLSESRACPR